MTEQVVPLEPFELRRIWPHEAHDFTTWMTAAEPLARLGHAVGLGPLEYVAHERTVGSFSADILARDPWGGPVIVENQLEATDHTHLGQALVYVAGIEQAATVIWVAARIRPEHAAALNWLNALTPPHIGFYGVVIRAWSINGSPPGYQFDVVIRPDDHKPNRADKKVGPVTAEAAAHQAYWSAFRDFLAARGAEHLIRPDLPRSGWWGRNLGRPGHNLYAVVKPKDKSLAVMLEISAADHGAAFAALAADKPTIESEIGEVLAWSSTEARDYISIERRDVDPTDMSQWSDQHAWLLDRLERFRRVFRDRVSRLPNQEMEGSEAASTGTDR